jgi:hypothetical protein
LARGCVPPQFEDTTANAYSAVEHLAYSVWLGAYKPNNLFAMFTAYFDESGNANDKNGTLTVAGGVSTIQKWLRLEAQWKDILKHHGVTVFHMQECAAGTGEYEGWGSDRRRKLVSDLSECIARNVKHTFSVTVLLEGWDRINEEFRLVANHGQPYAFCGRFVALCARSWMKRKGYTTPIRYVFEDGAKGKGQLVDLMSRHDGATPDFMAKSAPALQTADLIAWKTRRILRDLVNRPYTMTKEQLKASLAPISRVPTRYWVFDEKELLAFCGRHRVPRR